MKDAYPWEPIFAAAALETDNVELARRIEEARKVLDVRIRELTLDASAKDERRAIGDALYSLRQLWIERCQAADSSKS